MACQLGQELHDILAQSVAARLAIEERAAQKVASDIRTARRMENHALLVRAMHVSKCPECWLDLPRFLLPHRPRPRK